MWFMREVCARTLYRVGAILTTAGGALCSASGWIDAGTDWMRS